jgi:hypothetical protein
MVENSMANGHQDAQKRANDFEVTLTSFLFSGRRRSTCRGRITLYFAFLQHVRDISRTKILALLGQKIETEVVGEVFK